MMAHPEAVIPARKGRTNPQPHAPEPYKARNAVDGTGPRLAPTRAPRGHPLDQYAHRFLGFLYLAGA